MNVKGSDVLLGACIEGVRQLRGATADGRGGFDPIGLLLATVRCTHILLTVEEIEKPEVAERHEECVERAMEAYAMDEEEWEEINRLAHEEGYDFMTLAWKYRPGNTTPEQPDD